MKLDNIMLCENGYLKLIDFGMSRLLEGDELATTYSGTAEYISPEMLSRNAQYDTSIDWWAVGIIIYELISGVTPFFNFNRQRLNDNIRNKKVLWLKDVKCSRELKDLVEKLLVKDPSARLGS